MALTVRQRARVSRSVQYGLLALAVVLFILFADWASIGKAFFNWDSAVKQFPEIITLALKNTLIYTALSFVVGLSGGLLLALMKLSSVGPMPVDRDALHRVLPGAAGHRRAHGLRAAPASPGMEIPFGIYGTVWTALGIVAAAYMAETIRAGLQAVPKGQLEAARSLGMPHWRAMVKIVMPQAFKIVLPPLTNEVILLTKDSLAGLHPGPRPRRSTSSPSSAVTASPARTPASRRW